MANILLIAYDNGSHIPFFPINLFYLFVHLLKTPGNQIGIFSQDLEHYNSDMLTDIINTGMPKGSTVEEGYEDFDTIGLGFTAGYYQYQKAKEIAAVLNASPKRGSFNFLLGGHGPAAEPQFFMDKMQANVVIVGDGEDGLDRYSKGERGIIHADPCTEYPDNFFLYDRFATKLDLYKHIQWPTSKATDFCFPILSSRGCKWNCSFCYRMRKGFHMRPVDDIMKEIKWLSYNRGITHFQFADELLMANKERTEEICQAILRLNMEIKWDCNGRLNFAKPDTLKLMKKAGCEYINYGIESLNQKMLNEMNKGLTVSVITSGVEATLEAGISPGLNFIWGFPGDTPDNLYKAVKFLVKYDPCHELRTIRPLTPYPCTALYTLAIEEGLLDGPEDFYENKHKNSDLFTVNFMDISTKEAHACLLAANTKLVDNYYDKCFERSQGQVHKLYIDGDTDFRGFRDV